MLRLLLAKDLRRAWRNPLPWLINLLVPLCITAIIGLAFGGNSDSGALGRIRFALVDEDQTVLSDFLRGAANQREGGRYLEPVFLEREEAFRQINDNRISAVLVIPTNFMRNYLTGRAPVTLELIKNPAQSIHPAVLEELLGALVTGLNAISRNLQSEFPDWLAVFEGEGDYRKVSALIERAGNKLEVVGKYINPPLVSYTKEVRATAGAKADGRKSASAFNLFGYLLIGMVAMFLLFIASTAMSDLHRELRNRTFERYHTLQQRLVPFVGGKVVFAAVMLMLCSAVMLGGGALLFQIRWQQPGVLAVLTVGYSCFAAGLMALMTAVAANERLASVLDNIVGMGLALAGGCLFPPQQLPAFLRENITPWLPSYWFADTARQLENGADIAWWFVLLKLLLLGALLIGAAAVLFRRRFRAGIRA
jgi:ABC-type multidrug transport system permease subunit